MKPKKREVLELIPKQDLPDIATPLLQWYDQNARVLPWREEPTPYRVWVSEIMLQQTRVQAVLPYFQRFITALPTVRDLANASEEALAKLWEGLGYYSRVRNMQKAARIVDGYHDGKLPDTFDELIKLPGIGEYTAGAVASIAYGQRVPAVDGNVLRVFSRVFAIEEDVLSPRVKVAFTALAQEIMPHERPGDFNQALMELGATVCVPNGAPQCLVCPLRPQCRGYDLGTAPLLPLKAPKKERRIEKRTVLQILDSEGRMLLHKRPDKGLLGGLWELPSLPEHLTPDEIAAELADLGLTISGINPIGSHKHIFTHIVWQMQGYEVVATGHTLPHDPENWAWTSADQRRETYALPSAFKAFV